MATIKAHFQGWGNWRSGDYSPTPEAFVSELRRNGWHPSNFFLVSIGDRGYQFAFDIDDATTKNSPNIDKMRYNLYSYFAYYFDGLSLNIISSNTAPSNTSTTNNTTTTNNSNVVTKDDLQTLINGMKNLTPNPTALGTNQLASKLGISQGALIALGVAGIAVVFIASRR